MKSVTYMSEYYNTYLLLPPTAGFNVPLDAKTKVEMTCTVNQCIINQYVTDEEYIHVHLTPMLLKDLCHC